MSRKHLFVYALLMGLLPIMGYSQDDPDRRKVIVQNQDDYFGGYPDITNVVKMNPLLIFTGDIPIYYERKLTEKIGVEGAIGITTRNYLRDIWDFGTNPIYQQAEPPPYAYSDIIGKLGFSLRLAGRYYPANQVPAPHEFYFGPSIEFRNYNYAVPQVVDDRFSTSGYSFTNTETRGSTTFTDIKIMFGYNDFFEKNIMVEYYGGVGIRFRSADSFLIDRVEQSPNVWEYQTVVVPDNKTVPILSAGVKLGFGWK